MQMSSASDGNPPANNQNTRTRHPQSDYADAELLERKYELMNDTARGWGVELPELPSLRMPADPEQRKVWIAARDERRRAYCQVREIAAAAYAERDARKKAKASQASSAAPAGSTSQESPATSARTGSGDEDAKDEARSKSGGAGGAHARDDRGAQEEQG
ncbi:uncharacterized protein BKA78DRAFT_300110 [Phyllosticta capitalensis]|uniref:uncharacterized protein n=1 Tax=Phyllosticta capitalensis TaxID=121624 RepID=UPI00312F0EC0